ncbi:type 2 phosphatidylinositol 4,5-bisphosphate 4-phosphatase-like [Saccoglossus kowalevskii]|uniref:Phosphatidylinositol-4,5-bisphosphate 4-phosphatase n=1 Tax=Saccoglossus kowalevskii TaxID=10224 RepID=A0ABM0GIK5_SACKO|nr:PREDICTED: type 1 phosphatidylinositol 4,5-bisphosphate 4-phosphatase-like [Saccoglossus kowalevskii]
MADREEENAPLLQNEDNNSSPQQPYAPLPQVDTTELPPPMVGGPPPPILPDEQPPPYTPSPAGGVPMINCRVCQAMINIEGKLHQHVVKCNVCNEATPIKEAPAGKKYVRCPCNCLLICKNTSQRIACPRTNCKRIINLGPITVATVRTQVGSRVICGHCNETFLFNTTVNSLARCPHCRRVSSIGPKFAKNRCIIFAVIGIVFIVAGIGVTIGTYELAEESGGIYFVWIGAFIIGILNLVRSCYYGTMRVSQIEGPA